MILPSSTKCIFGAMQIIHTDVMQFASQRCGTAAPSRKKYLGGKNCRTVFPPEILDLKNRTPPQLGPTFPAAPEYDAGKIVSVVPLQYISSLPLSTSACPSKRNQNCTSVSQRKRNSKICGLSDNVMLLLRIYHHQHSYDKFRGQLGFHEI